MRGRRVARPRPSPLTTFDLAWIAGLQVGIVTALWVRHGRLDQLATPGGVLMSVGQLAGLYGALAVLAELVLISRTPWLERLVGMDRLNGIHRWLGFAAIWLLAGHAVTITLGYAASVEIGVWEQVVDFVVATPWVLAAIVGLGLMVGVGIVSARAARRRMSYETWWLIHLYAYLGVALAFMHQIVVGADFKNDGVATAYWIALYLAVAVAILGFRWLAPLRSLVRHRLRVAAIVPEGPSVYSLFLAGRDLDRLAVDAGQFFLLRFLRTDRWWKAHPFSVSAAPDGRLLRFTIKVLGDDTAALASIPVGTLVVAEGPYGAFTAARSTDRPILLIAGGIGVAPLRALYEDLDRAPGEVDLLYRARRRDEAPLLDELMAIRDRRGYGLFVSYSRPDDHRTGSDPFRAGSLLAAVPDVAERDVFICGPARMYEAAIRGLRTAGVPADHIHFETFAD
jgi:predicted ferric reductase